MLKKITVLCCFAFLSSHATASPEALHQASSFANIYASLCLKHLSNLNGLRQTLKDLPKLPTEKAVHFLAGKTGDAWPVPDKYGTFVLAIPSQQNFCAVHARRADTEAARKYFMGMVATAPLPLVAKQVTNKQQQTRDNVLTQTIAYEWSTPNTPRKMLFTLTTASSENAQLQVLGSAAIIDK